MLSVNIKLQSTHFLSGPKFTIPDIYTQTRQFNSMCCGFSTSVFYTVTKELNTKRKNVNCFSHILRGKCLLYHFIVGYIYIYIYIYMGLEGRSQWPRGLRRRSAAARLLRLWVRIPPGAWMSVCCECCVFSGRGLCDELITRPEESYRLWCDIVCDLETS